MILTIVQKIKGRVGIIPDLAAFVVPYCYLFLLSVFILWFSHYVSDIF